MHRTIPILLMLLVAGCGGASSEPAPPEAKAKPRQQIDRYAMTMSAQQKDEILRDDPNPIVGRWRMDLNRTLGIVDVHAPDGGGITLYIKEMTDDRLVLDDPDCGNARLTFTLERSGDELRFTEGSGRCQETIDVLALNPWRAA